MSRQAVEWPGKARIAVSIVVNFEEGAERLGDEYAEPSHELGAITIGPAAEKIRNRATESLYRYGVKAGFWRLMSLFDKYHIKTTFLACGQALEKNPEAAREITKRGHEPAGHGYRWIEQFNMSRDEERDFIRKTVIAIQNTTGQRPLGWLCRFGEGPNTREILLEEGFVYDSDSFEDDLPYYEVIKGQKLVIVPYSMDTNDFKFWRTAGFYADQFERYLKDTFDYLYEEGATKPKMMSIGLHLRICGTPARALALDRFIRYAKGFSRVWFARRIDIAKWWLDHYV